MRFAYRLHEPDLPECRLCARYRVESGLCADSPKSTRMTPTATLAVHCGNDFDAGFSPYQSTHLSRYNLFPQLPGEDMKRRDFIALLGGAAGWPLAARAQQPAMPVIGFLDSRSPDYANAFAAFPRASRRSVMSKVRTWRSNTAGPMVSMIASPLVADLVRRQVSRDFRSGSPPAAPAVKAATATIPDRLHQWGWTR